MTTKPATTTTEVLAAAFLAGLGPDRGPSLTGFDEWAVQCGFSKELRRVVLAELLRATSVEFARRHRPLERRR